MVKVPSREIELLLLSVRAQPTAEQARRIRELLSLDLDWAQLIETAERHGLTPLLNRTLSRRSGEIAADTLDKLRTICEAIRFRNVVFVRELLGVMAAFESAGVKSVPYKGPALATYLFQDIALRQSSDIDVLVRPCDAAKARRVLLDMGYVALRAMPDSVAAAYARLHFTFVLVSRGGVQVDLAWRISPRYWRLPEFASSAWERLGRLSLWGASIPWLAPKDLLFVLCIHACKHRWESLKWVVDVAQWLHIHPLDDLRAAVHDAEQGGYARMLALNLILAHDLFDAPLPEDVVAAARSLSMVEALAAEVCESLFATHPEPVGTQAALSMVARAADRLDTKLLCGALLPVGYFLVQRAWRPGVTGVRRAFAREVRAS